MGKNVVVKDIIEKNGEKCFLGKNVAGKNVVGKNVFGENCLAPYFNNFLIAVPPSVQPQPQDGKFVVRKGSTITLECDSKGNPPPKITWQRSVSILLF